MANWNGLLLTDKGRDLAAKVEAGKTKLSLTKIKLGDGLISGSQTLETLSDLVSPKQVIGITSLEVTETGGCTIAGTITNAELAAGYNVKELGIFATDPDIGEILYCITTDSNYDYLPAKGGATVVSEEFFLHLAIENTDNVVAIIDPNALLTVAGANKLIKAHNTDESAHAVLFKTATSDNNQEDNSGKGASTSWVRSILGKWTAFKSSQISDLKTAVNDTVQSDNSGKGASTSWVKGLINNHIASKYALKSELTTIVTNADTQYIKKSGIQVLTGVINDGGTLPIPPGFKESECHWGVSIYRSNVNEWRFDPDESHNSNLLEPVCTSVGRVVHVGTQAAGLHGISYTQGGSLNMGKDWARVWIPGSARYICIGIHR